MVHRKHKRQEKNGNRQMILVTIFIRNGFSDFFQEKVSNFYVTFLEKKYLNPFSTFTLRSSVAARKVCINAASLRELQEVILGNTNRLKERRLVKDIADAW